MKFTLNPKPKGAAPAGNKTRQQETKHKKQNRRDGAAAICVVSISFLNEGKLDGAAGALVL
jgi:hypothetical protein